MGNLDPITNHTYRSIVSFTLSLLLSPNHPTRGGGTGPVRRRAGQIRLLIFLGFAVTPRGATWKGMGPWLLTSLELLNSSALDKREDNTGRVTISFHWHNKGFLRYQGLLPAFHRAQVEVWPLLPAKINCAILCLGNSPMDFVFPFWVEECVCLTKKLMKSSSWHSGYSGMQLHIHSVHPTHFVPPQFYVWVTRRNLHYPHPIPTTLLVPSPFSISSQPLPASVCYYISVLVAKQPA